MKEPVTYGVVVFAAVAFVGWSTGMGGGLLPNLGFSALMGILAGVLFALVQKYARRKE